MALTNQQIEKMVKSVFELWNQKSIVTFKENQEKVFKRAVEIIKAEFEKEKQIDQEANRLCDQLEQQQPGMERHKLFQGIKKRLAKEKKVIL